MNGNYLCGLWRVEWLKSRGSITENVKVGSWRRTHESWPQFHVNLIVDKTPLFKERMDPTEQQTYFVRTLKKKHRSKQATDEVTQSNQNTSQIHLSRLSTNADEHNIKRTSSLLIGAMTHCFK